MKKTDNKASVDKRYALKDLQQAIAPFEDLLISNLPNKEDVLTRCKQRKVKKNIGQVLLLWFAIGGCVYYIDPVYQTENYHAELGERKQFRLGDGTQIYLNSNTQLVVAYGLRSKRFNLQEGEVSFAVQHYAQAWLQPFERKFLVSSGNLQIEDIGTVFNVRHYDLEHSVVSVQKGQVRLSTLAQPASTNLDLFTGQSAEYKDGLLQLHQPTDIESYTAWQQGYIQFKDRTLIDAMAEFQRYQTLNVEFADDAAQKIQVSGRFRADDAEQFIQLLPQISSVQLAKSDSGAWIIKQKLP